MLLWADNFAHYGKDPSFMLDGLYASVSNAFLVNDPATPFTDTVITLAPTAGSTALLRKVLPAAYATVGVSVRVYFPNLPTIDGGLNGNAGNLPVVFTDNANNRICAINVSTTGSIRLYSANGVLLAETDGPAITAKGWWHLEVKMSQGAAGAAAFELRVEGVTKISSTTLNFGNLNNCAQIWTANAATANGSFGGMLVKDLIIWNTAGAYNNNFLGSCSVFSIVPTSDAALNWGLTGGPNGYSILDNAPPDNAAFISAPFPLPAAYVAGMSDLPPDVTTVKGVITLVRAAKSDGGDGSLQVSVVSAGIPGNGANRPITVAQTYWFDVFEMDPNTLAPWLPSAINAVQLKINRTV